MCGKLIVIEGTDCSGKQTQSEMLTKKLQNQNLKVVLFSFPMYDTPTGKIIGGPYLGKPEISPSWFTEGATKVDPKVISLYFAADRAYNIPIIKKHLDEGYIVILDRYTYSNMAHQGSKIDSAKERNKLYEWLYKLEFDFLGLPVPDKAILLYMPYENGEMLRQSRLKNNLHDEHEKDSNHLKKSEIAYLEIAKKYNWSIINCVQDGNIRTIDNINEELIKIVLN